MQLGDTTACDCRGRVLVCGASSGGVHGESGNSTSELSAMTGEQTTAVHVFKHKQCCLLDEEMKNLNYMYMV